MLHKPEVMSSDFQHPHKIQERQHVPTVLALGSGLTGGPANLAEIL